MTAACGHSRRARVIDMAERTPNTRAAYVADKTTPRLPPPMITGRLCTSGRSRLATAARRGARCGVCPRQAGAAVAASDEHGKVVYLWPVPDRDSGEEGVHVHMDHR